LQQELEEEDTDEDEEQEDRQEQLIDVEVQNVISEEDME